MLYEQYTIGGELMHSAKGVEWKNKKYIDKVRTKTGKWRYIYKNSKVGTFVNNTKNYRTNKKRAEELNEKVDKERRKLWPNNDKTSDINDNWAPRGTSSDKNGVSRDASRGYDLFQHDYRKQYDLNEKMDNSAQGVIEEILDKLKIKKKNRKIK